MVELLSVGRRSGRSRAHCSVLPCRLAPGGPPRPTGVLVAPGLASGDPHRHHISTPLFGANSSISSPGFRRRAPGLWSRVVESFSSAANHWRTGHFEHLVKSSPTSGRKVMALKLVIQIPCYNEQDALPRTIAD